MDELDARIARDNARVGLQVVLERMAEIEEALAIRVLDPAVRAELEGILVELTNCHDKFWLFVNGMDPEA
jgi:hypothetical protein